MYNSIVLSKLKINKRDVVQKILVYNSTYFS